MVKKDKVIKKLKQPPNLQYFLRNTGFDPYHVAWRRQ